MKYYTWSDREKDILKQLYPKYGLQACVDYFCIRETQVRSQIRSLGLKLKDEDIIKQSNYKKGSNFRGKKRPEHSKWLSENHPMLGKHHSIETRNKISISQHNILPNKIYSNSKRGYYDIGGKPVYFRSKWEANYALYLDFLIKNHQIKSWEFEKDVFWFEKIKRGVRSYCPDFKIVNNDDSIEYHEVKGYFDSKSKTKMKRMKKYYPDIKLLLIDSSVYKAIIKKMNGIISFY